MKSKQPSYPFIPRTTTRMTQGEFWALPLRDGSFGCGRVVQLVPGKRVSFLGAVLDWHSDSLPTSESIAGAKCLAQGESHLRAITETGGSILGHRPLEFDEIVPWEFRSASLYLNSNVQLGLVPMRAQRTEDDHLPVFTSWGYRFPVILAERRFL